MNDVSFTNCFVDCFGSQIRFIIYILPENTGPHCNYKIIETVGGWSPPTPPAPPSGEAPVINE